MASFRDILGYYRAYWTTSVLTVVATSGFELLDLVVPYALGQILNTLSGQPLDGIIAGFIAGVSNLTGVPEGTNLSLGVLLGLVFISTVIRAPLQPWLGDWFHWDIALRSRRDHSQRVVEKILTLPLSFYDENNPGRIAGRVARGLSNHTWTYPDVAGDLIPKLVRIVGIFLVIWFVSRPIAIAFLASFIIILGFSLKKLSRLVRKETVIDRYIENTESRTSEIITNIKTVKAFAAEANELKRQRLRMQRELDVIIYRIHRGYTTLVTWQRLMVQTCMFLVLVFTLRATLQGNITIGNFVTTLTVASIAYAELSPIGQLAEVFARRYASMIRFHEFMKQPSGSDAASLIPESLAENPYRFTGKLEFEGVTFGYDPDRPVLHDISLLIEPCQTVALVGRSGSGKSTLVKLLFRYFEPTQGRISIDGEDIRTLDTARYRRRLAIVHQDVDIFNGTLLDNLTYGNPHATMEEVEEACAIARVSDFVKELPGGYYTIVGERGVRLSGGQRQRIGIARALIVNPDVLVFDEATSSLDYESERSIQMAMHSILGTRTTVIIAHRLSTIREADRIVVLDAGRIVEVGSHDELLRHGGLYHRLHALSETGDLLS